MSDENQTQSTPEQPSQPPVAQQPEPSQPAEPLPPLTITSDPVWTIKSGDQPSSSQTQDNKE